MRIKIAKGLYWRAGSIGVHKISQDVLSLIDSGTAFLTNKRIIFMGGKKNTNIALNKILDINPYSNGVEIHKATGKSPFIEISNNADIFCMILVEQ
jgi:hypothetical protein